MPIQIEGERIGLGCANLVAVMERFRYQLNGNNYQAFAVNMVPDLTPIHEISVLRDASIDNQRINKGGWGADLGSGLLHLQIFFAPEMRRLFDSLSFAPPNIVQKRLNSQQFQSWSQWGF